MLRRFAESEKNEENAKYFSQMANVCEIFCTFAEKKRVMKDNQNEIFSLVDEEGKVIGIR